MVLAGGNPRQRITVQPVEAAPLHMHATREPNEPQPDTFCDIEFGDKTRE